MIEVNGIHLHTVSAGQGPLVLLLHGFPQSSYSWRKQIPALAKNFHVVAPDLRGYGASDKPTKVEDYQIDKLTGDIVNLIHKLGYEKAHIVGHDWGGAIAWRLAHDHPEVVERLVILNSPHPILFKKALRSNWQQMKRSWYFYLFQIPYLSEAILSKPDVIKKLLRNSSLQKETFTEEDLNVYAQALAKPGAATPVLNYYRAALRHPSKPKNPTIKAPTLVIWGEGDKALGKELTYDMKPFFDGPFEIRYLPNTSHWVQEEQPEQVTALISEFLQKQFN